MKHLIFGAMIFSFVLTVKSFLSPLKFRLGTTTSCVSPHLFSLRNGLSDVTFVNDRDDDGDDPRRSNSKSPSRPKDRKQSSKVTSWKERNQNFLEKVDTKIPRRDRNVENTYDENRRNGRNRSEVSWDSNRRDKVTSKDKSFLDLRGTRVFVKNVPSHVTWQALKDHFGIAGSVIYASISVDRETGEPKDHGIVEFETKEEAQNAIQIIRDHPLEGAKLYVRADIKGEENKKGSFPGREGKEQQSTSPGWRCANEDALELIDPDSLDIILSLIQTRDSARRNANYVKSDQIREELKAQHGVHIDDRLKMWWVSLDGKHIPESVASIKGDGRWGSLKSWSRIPTSPENDALVNSNLVYRLLRQRDMARQEKDFIKADKLLEQVVACGAGDLTIRIHDESRTWRIWTKDQPEKVKFERPEGSSSVRDGKKKKRDENDNLDSKAVYDECMSLVNKYAPEKVDEIREMLTVFQGREITILNKLKTRFMV
jgi:RNA recognition motif-containing protein